MSVNGIEAITGLSGGNAIGAADLGGVAGNFDNVIAGAPGGVSSASGAEGPSGPGSAFTAMFTEGLDKLEGLKDRADSLAVQAATGDLNAIHDYTIAATEASVSMELAVSMRNKAVEAFTEIMRMPV